MIVTFRIFVALCLLLIVLIGQGIKTELRRMNDPEFISKRDLRATDIANFRRASR